MIELGTQEQIFVIAGAVIVILLTILLIIRRKRRKRAQKEMQLRQLEYTNAALRKEMEEYLEQIEFENRWLEKQGQKEEKELPENLDEEVSSLLKEVDEIMKEGWKAQRSSPMIQVGVTTMRFMKPPLLQEMEEDLEQLDLKSRWLENQGQKTGKGLSENLDEEVMSLLKQVDGIMKEDWKAQRSTPVIQVDMVSMIFRISTSNTSGLKEYMIQSLKHQIGYRELLALDHISFDIYEGEVVGIIGTNGSGKSTLLKIIAGALKPTSGRVTVDQRKMQILTLGTGFDMELTARENVYLNGSIIGYSKEFLDANYEKIVEFAELEGFMEERVKNFSSGMVSRLGFAIATAGDAAEILILDEVLSVGDEFFRKKSLKRIKEMIHGGSTVLLVSHSMGTILENCTKVVWIEKGKLQMVGEAEEVCEAYGKHQG